MRKVGIASTNLDDALTIERLARAAGVSFERIPVVLGRSRDVGECPEHAALRLAEEARKGRTDWIVLAGARTLCVPAMQDRPAVFWPSLNNMPIGTELYARAVVAVMLPEGSIMVFRSESWGRVGRLRPFPDAIFFPTVDEGEGSYWDRAFLRAFDCLPVARPET